MGKNISAAVLAGGTGKRFNGKVKSKIVIEGKTIISGIIETFDDIFDEILIVTNSPAEFKEFSDCKIISDQFRDRGPLGGIHSALKATTCEAIFIVAGDMPFLRREFIVRQIDCFYKTECDILIPKNDKFIEPLHGIYRKSIVLKLEEYLVRGEDCAIREFFKMVNVKYLDFEGSEESMRAFTNINSPSDLFIIKQSPRSTE